MRLLSSLLIGSLLLSHTPLAYAASLYDQVKEQMDLELRAEKVDDPVKDFIAAIAKEKKWDITADEVESIVSGSTGVCSKHESLEAFGCIQVLQRIRTMVTFENEVRLAGRRLQAIATGYELPVSEIPRKTQALPADLNSVVSLWKAGTGSVQASGTGVIRMEQISDEDIAEQVEEVASALEDLKEEERIAAVWRYQYGSRLVNDERKPDFPAPDVQKTLKDKDGNDIECDKGERRFLCKRWEDVERALRSVWSKLPTKFSPPLGPKEAVYFKFEKKTLDLLPDNVILWARMDAKAPFPLGDVGLQWEYPLDPVLPALKNEGGEAILGGEYPPEPPQKQIQNTKVRMELERAGELDAGSGLCTMSVAQRGYLCRPMERPLSDCPEGEEDADAIMLVGCTSKEKAKTTTAGPDVCKDVGWRDAGSGGTVNKPVCTPEELSKYRNSIGNNLCFIGECVEQSLETHRVTPGRIPAGVQDEAFPYDDPLAGSPLGNFLTAPATGQPVLPPYRPLVPVHEFEAALCALSGLPAGAPSALCTIEASRRTEAPLTDGISTIMSLFQMEAQQKLGTQELESLAQSVGTRIGTDLYARNMRMASKSLSEVIGIATKLLKEIKSIDFPAEMCAMGPSDAPASAPIEE